MNYTLLKQWKTLSGEYHSATEDYKTYDSAIGNFHNKFLPMMNDTNVASFRFQLIDEYGADVAHCTWTRAIPTEEPTETLE